MRAQMLKAALAAGEDAVLGAGKGGGEVIRAGHAQALWGCGRVHAEEAGAQAAVAARRIHRLLQRSSAQQR